MSVIVIGADPGDSAGIAVLGNGNTPFISLIKAYQGKPEDALTLVEIMLNRFRSADFTIACERFVDLRGRRGHTQQPTAQRMCGALERLAKRYGVRFTYQGPADARAIAPTELLQRLGLYQTSVAIGQRDANDVNMAVRHALFYLAQHHTTLFDALLRRAGVESA